MPVTQRDSVLVGSSTGRTPSNLSVRAAKRAAVGLSAAVGGGECTLGCTVQQQRLGEHGSARPTVSSAVADADVVAEAAQSLASALEPGINKQVQTRNLSLCEWEGVLLVPPQLQYSGWHEAASTCLPSCAGPDECPQGKETVWRQAYVR